MFGGNFLIGNFLIFLIGNFLIFLIGNFLILEVIASSINRMDFWPTDIHSNTRCWPRTSPEHDDFQKELQCCFVSLSIFVNIKVL